MRLGIFGGSFDPVHVGHLALARACQHHAALDEVWFMPVSVQPLKHRGPHATNEHRIEMLRLATKTDPTWRVCTIETDRGGLSYSVDTLRQIHEQLPEASLFFLVGADTLRDVARWKEPQELFRLATPLVVHRPGEPEPDLSSLATLCSAENKPRTIDIPTLDVSSSNVRQCVAASKTVDELVPRAVAEYIQAHGLYR
jgi:nicotinate-nucleotide adenylyltransferase